MMRLQHRFELLLLTADGDTIGQLPMDPNWEPALECVRLEAERKGYPPRAGRPRHARVEPVPDAKSGPPRCRGFEAVLDCGRGREVRAFFPFTYFKEEARRGAAHYVEQRKLKAGDTFLYRLLALPGTPRAPRPKGTIIAEEIDDPYPVEPGSLEALEARSVSFGTHREGQLPVFIPERVLDQAAALTRAAGRLETGGILIGRLLRDKDRRDLGVDVTALIPARHAEAERMQIAFTADTFEYVRHAIDVRGRGEIMLGSMHSHPFLCNPDCPPESRRVCPLQSDFFSSQDVQMHTTLFPKAYTIALVATISDEGLRHALFAWDEGVIRQRGFFILDPTKELPTEAPSNPNPNTPPAHETPCP